MMMMWAVFYGNGRNHYNADEADKSDDGISRKFLVIKKAGDEEVEVEIVIQNQQDIREKFLLRLMI
jgi:hypothetical protein